MAKALKLENRGIIRLTGSQRKTFLQGLITNDIDRLAPDQPVYAAMLTPQGKYLFDFIIFENDQGDVLLDADLNDMTDLIQRLTMYKLRADVQISDATQDLHVWAFDEDIPGIPLDPRHTDLGARAILASPPDLPVLDAESYREKRIRLGIPNGHIDLERDKYFWLECGAERLNGVDFHKGCYVGQEQTARMKHRSTLKKGIIPVTFEPPAPDEGADIINGEGKVIGKLHSVGSEHALAFVRFERMTDGLSAGGVAIRPL